VNDLRAVIVIDYQNVHLTGHGLFNVSRYEPLHKALVDPLSFAHQVIQRRNALQRNDMARAVLKNVLVFRGQPSPVHDAKAYARNQSHKAHWERDKRVTVHQRPLKYLYDYDDDGEVLMDLNGDRIYHGKREKGIDVLCALAVVSESLKSSVDLVILASADSDLAPALDHSLDLGKAKIETTSWFDAAQPMRSSQLRPTRRTIWNTRLGEVEFERCWDRTEY
jgi:uncharacterized LabA/DUF88 family protein